LTGDDRCYGSVLATSEIRRRAGEIFSSGWEEASLQAASYDLRIAPVLLILPDGERYNEDRPRRESFVLKPGDVALVSTVERIKVPWDLIGNISIKFSYARRGILILTGLIVDPGYGSANLDGERLHFVIANTSTEALPINPGVDRIASLQFITLCGEPDQDKAVSSVDWERELFEAEPEPKLALGFFEELAGVRHRVDRFEASIRGTRDVVFFGVFLIAATLFAGFTTTILLLASAETLSARVEAIVNVLPSSWPQAIVALAILAAVTTGLIAISKVVARRS
jgi:deoxycytidine triphosphate deaminase